MAPVRYRYKHGPLWHRPEGGWSEPGAVAHWILFNEDGTELGAVIQEHGSFEEANHLWQVRTVDGTAIGHANSRDEAGDMLVANDRVAALEWTVGRLTERVAALEARQG